MKLPVVITNPIVQWGAAVVQLSGHQPGNHEVPSLVLGFDSWLGPPTAVVSLGKKLYPYFLSHTHLSNWDLLYDIDQGTAEKQPLAYAVSLYKYHVKKSHDPISIYCFPLLQLRESLLGNPINATAGKK